MKILLVNPNTTASMTEKAGEAARLVAASGTEIIAVNPEYGPVSIEGYYDEVFSIPACLRKSGKEKTPDVREQSSPVLMTQVWMQHVALLPDR